MESESDLTYREVFGKEVDWTPDAPVTFWLTRHGVSEYNLEDRIGGDSNIAPDGQIFANTLPSLFGKVLQESREDHRFISVWTSTLIRTIQTASKLPLPQVHLKELDEINAGVCDGATYEYIKRYMPYIHYNRKKDKLRYRYPSGESYIDLCKRVWPIVRQLKAHGGKKLIVGHQAVLRCIFGYLEGRPLKDITHLGVPHHFIFQFTVHPDGKIARKDFHMDLVRDPANPQKPIPGWPFDVSHSRPLTATDIARYSPKPLAPLLIDRVVSLSDAPPTSSTAADNSQGVPPPALPMVLPDADTCAAVAADQSSSITATAPVAMHEKASEAEALQSQGRAGRLKAGKLSRASLKIPGTKSGINTSGLRTGGRQLWTCKSHMPTTPATARMSGQDSAPEGPARLNSAPGALTGCLESFQESFQPEVSTDHDAAVADEAAYRAGSLSVLGTDAGGSISQSQNIPNTHETPFSMSPDSHLQFHAAPSPPQEFGGSPAPCSIPEKCSSLLAQTLAQHAQQPEVLSSNGHLPVFPAAMDARPRSIAPTVVLPSDASSFSSAYAPKSLYLQQHPRSSCSGAASRTRSGDGLSSGAGPSKDNSPLKQPQDDATSNSHSDQKVPSEVRCMACGAMVPVHSRPCDIKPPGRSSENMRNGLVSYLPDGIMSSMTWSSLANESRPVSAQLSYAIESAFDIEDSMPQLNQPAPPAACPSPELRGDAQPALAQPSARSQPGSGGNGAGAGTPQLQMRQAMTHYGAPVAASELTCLDVGSGDPCSEYPGSPCAPYPLVSTLQHQRAMSELALAFHELRVRGACASNNNCVAGGSGSVLAEPACSAAHCGRLSIPHMAHPHGPETLVAEDPCVRAEELRRKLEDSQGFHFRGDACRLVESSLQDSERHRDESAYNPLMHQSADFAW